MVQDFWRSVYINFNKLEADLDMETNTPDPLALDCKNSKFCYQPAGHIITRNLKIILDSRIRSIIYKGPKYGLPSRIHFNYFREEIAAA